MNTNIIILIAVLGGVVALIGAAYLGYILAKKGVNVKDIEVKADKFIDYAERAGAALEPFLPTPYNKIVSVVTNLAAKTVQTTESLYNASMLPADKRKEAATNIIIKDMQDAQLPVDDNVRKLISVAIDAACLVLPGHMSTENAAAAQATATQAQ